MDGKDHRKWYYISAVPFFIYLLYVYQWFAFYYLLLVIDVFKRFDPDEDQKFFNGKYHRWGFTHSMFDTFIFCLAIYMIPGNSLTPLTYSLFLFPVIIHLLCDLTAKGEREGKWRIHWFGRLSKNKSILFLLINIVIGIAVILYATGAFKI